MRTLYSQMPLGGLMPSSLTEYSVTLKALLCSVSVVFSNSSSSLLFITISKRPSATIHDGQQCARGLCTWNQDSGMRKLHLVGREPQAM